MTVLKIDSNVVGLRIAEEESLKTLAASPVFKAFAVNKFGDFGPKLTTVARDTINASRQRQKGTVTDLDGSAAFTIDLTASEDQLWLFQGLFCADARQKKTTAPLNAAAIDLGAVTGSAHTVAAASGLDGFLASHLVKLSGFGVAANNGLFKVSTSVAALLTLASGLSDEANAPAAARIEAVGYEFAADTVDITIVGGLPRISRVSGTFDLTTLGLIAGEPVFLGADAAANVYANNTGWARVSAVGATYLEFDKTSWTPQAEVGTGKSIRLFFGTVLKNENDPTLIKTRTYQLERTLGSDDDGVMSEYGVGSVFNKATFRFPGQNKVELDVEFLACDFEQRDGATGQKTATRPSLVLADIFNTSSDFRRIKLSTVDPTTAVPSPLFAYSMDAEVSANNNASLTKALGVLGGFDITKGNFEVSGKTTTYFNSVKATQAVRNNADATLDIAMAKKNQGIFLDLSLMTLGGGRAAVEKNKAITLPFDVDAAQGKFDSTLLYAFFPYLPTAIAP